MSLLATKYEKRYDGSSFTLSSCLQQAHTVKRCEEKQIRAKRRTVRSVSSGTWHCARTCWSLNNWANSANHPKHRSIKLTSQLLPSQKTKEPSISSVCCTTSRLASQVFGGVSRTFEAGNICHNPAADHAEGSPTEK